MPPKAAKAPEKVVPKDEAQVVYVNFKLKAPAPPAPVPPAAPAPASTTAAAAPAPTSPPAMAESPSKGALKSPKGAKAPEPTPAPAPVPAAPPVEEMEEAKFEIIANLLCRSDIFIDYVRRQGVKLIQEKLAVEDPEKKVGDPMRAKLKDLQTELTGKTCSDLVLRDAAGVDIVFQEDLSQNALTKMAPLSSYTLGIVQADKSVVLLNAQ